MASSGARSGKADPLISNPDLLQRGEPSVQALRSLRVTGVLASTVAIGAEPWAASIPHPDDCLILYVMTRGRCVGGTLEPRQLVDLQSGDALLLPRAGRCMMAQSRDVTPVPLEQLLQQELGSIDSVEAKWKTLFASPFLYQLSKGGEAVVGVTALRMFFDPQFHSAVIDGLPPLIHLQGFVGRNRSFVEAMLTQITEQGEIGLSGQNTATRLAEALLVRCLAEYLLTFGEDRPGFARGLKDPYVARVIGAIQGDPAAQWTTTRMSRSAGLSRSAFADRFRATMNMTPAQFVTAVRMARAAELLHGGKASIAQIAERTGYGSEAAFSRAFRKWSGSPPGALRRSGAAQPASIAPLDTRSQKAAS